MADQILDGIERVNTIQLCGVDDRSESCISPGSPSGAETADDLPMHDRWTQVPFADIIGRTDICTVQKNKQAIPVFMVPFRESFGFGLFQLALEQPVADVLDPLNLGLELGW